LIAAVSLLMVLFYDGWLPQRPLESRDAKRPNARRNDSRGLGCQERKPVPVGIVRQADLVVTPT
jgi:hypothetical protein